MSTKTLLKRIALVAVSAMGIGLLSSVVPANAAGTSTITVTSIARAGLGATIKIVSDTTTITTSEQAHWSLISAPTGGALATGSGALVAASTGSNYTANVTEDTTAGNNLVAGTYSILVWVNTTSGTSGNGGAYPAIGDVATTHTMTVAGGPSSVVVTSPATSVAAGSTANGKFVATVKDANGANTFLTTNEVLTIKATSLVTGTILAKPTAVTGTETLTSTVQALTTSIGAVNSGTWVNNYTFYVANSAATTTTVTVGGGQLLAAGFTAATGTMTTTSLGNASAATVTSTQLGVIDANGIRPSGKNITAGTGTFTVAGSDVALTASTVTGKSISFALTGTAADVIPVTVAVSGTSTLPTGVTAGTSTVTIGTDGKATFVVAATSVLASNAYKITFQTSAAGTGVSYVVTYAAPNVSSNSGAVTLDPADTVLAKAVIGSSNTVTATVVDQFGDAMSGANVWFSVSGRNVVASTPMVTNASGKASMTYTDAKTTAGTDTIAVSAAAATSTTVANATSTTIAFASTNSVGSIAVAQSAAVDADNLIDALVYETATVKDANGNAIQGILVTFSVSAAGYNSGTATGWTNNLGQVSKSFAGKTVGTATVTASAGGQSASKAFLVVTDATKSRTITLSSATVAITGGDTMKVTATVRDGYGNAVAGQTLNVSYTGTAGRISAINGVIGSTGTTAVDGTMIIDLTAALTEAGTGTLTVAGTLGVTSTTLTLNGDAVTAMPALVKSATSVATVTASNAAAVATAAANKAILDAVAAIAAKAASDKAESDAKIALLQAALDAAADAAAEAIDAGNNANDSANAAAEAADSATAAAQQAGEDAVAAAEAAGAAAVAAAQSAQDAAAEATDAATAATDAANAAAEAADAATAAAQDAADAVAALSVQVTEVVASLKKQITALTNLVIRIQKKVKA
jgi:hypothetical protein